MRVIAIALALCCAAPLALAAPGGTIPFKQEPAGAPWSGAGLALLAVSLVAIVAVLVVRKRLGLTPTGTGPRMLRIVEIQRLGPRALLSVIEYKGEHYLVSYSEQGVTCLVPPKAGEGA
jgi:flagellar biogenesis protein FliO